MRELLEQRKAAGQSRARARDCPGNAANSKSSQHINTKVKAKRYKFNIGTPTVDSVK
jgi:hypothetical protein